MGFFIIDMFYRCEECNYVSTDLALANPKRLCPNCGKSAENIGRRMFPRVEAQVYRRMVQKYFTAEKANSRQVLNEASKIINQSYKDTEKLFDGLIANKNENAEQAVMEIKKRIELEDENDVFKILQLSVKYSSSDEMKTCLVLVDSMIESLLFEFLDEISFFYSIPDQIRGGILEQIKSRQQLVAYIESFLGFKFSQLVPKFDLGKGFWENINQIRTQRNKFMHGNPYAIGREDYLKALDVAQKAAKIFTDLNNKYLTIK